MDTEKCLTCDGSGEVPHPNGFAICRECLNRKRKGAKGGNCNRTACQQPGAAYYNHSTQKYYCKVCAEDLNDYNRTEAMRLYGHDLCTLDKEFKTDGQRLVEFCDRMMGCE